MNNIDEWEEEARIRNLLLPLTSEDGSFTKSDKLERLMEIAHELTVDKVRIANAAKEPRQAEELAVFREAQIAYIESSKAVSATDADKWARQAVKNFRKFRDEQ